MARSAQILANHLKKNNLSIAFAESVTCGLATHGLGNIIGASDFLKGSIVCYDEDVKINFLKVKQSLIKKYTCESQQVTDELAKNLRLLFKADVYAAVTGLAAAGGSETAGSLLALYSIQFIVTINFTALRKDLMANRWRLRKKHVMNCLGLYTGIPELPFLFLFPSIICSGRRVNITFPGGAASRVF